MAQLKIPADNFNLMCYFTCRTFDKYEPDAGGETATYLGRFHTKLNTPETASADIRFNVDVPSGATITSAKVCATLSSPLYGANTCTINGVSVSTGNRVEVDVTIPDDATSLNVPCRFLCNNPSHTHDPGSETPFIFTSGGYEYHNWYYDHESRLDYTDVCLLIEYTPAIEFAGWTDDPLVVGETHVKAVHMTELQEWAAVLSEYADNGTPTFTPAVPGETSLALWLTQVQEIRAVLDIVSPNHDAWIDVAVNCPRADVMEQIRAVIVAAM